MPQNRFSWSENKLITDSPLAMRWIVSAISGIASFDAAERLLSEATDAVQDAEVGIPLAVHGDRDADAVGQNLLSQRKVALSTAIRIWSHHGARHDRGDRNRPELMRERPC